MNTAGYQGCENVEHALPGRRSPDWKEEFREGSHLAGPPSQHTHSPVQKVCFFLDPLFACRVPELRL